MLALASRNWSPRPLEWSRGARNSAIGLGFAGLAGVVALAIVLPVDSPLVYRGGLALASIASAAAIAGAIVPGSPLGRVLDLRAVAWVGARSYGLYLWHWPVFVLATAALPEWDRAPLGPLGIAAISLAITVVAATLSYRFIEQPIRRDGFRASWKAFASLWRRGSVRVAVASVASLVLASLVVTTAVAIATAPVAGVAQAQIEAGQAAIDSAPTAPTVPSNSPTIQPGSIPGGDQITALGDSVMLAAAPEILKDFPGISIDAVVSRRMTEAPTLVQQLIDSKTLRPILLIGLGTNGPVDEQSLEQVEALAGSKTEIILVNAQAPRGWIPGVNATLAAFAQKYRNVELANWYSAIQPRLDVLARDKIHAGGPIGGQIYAGAVRDAIQRLAELPPLLSSNDYGLSPRPS